MEYIILSNNSRLENNVAGLPVRRIAGGLPEFYAAAAEALQNNHELVSSLIPPNVPLIRSPVRSVIMRRTERQYDAQGLLSLEKAKERTLALGVNEAERIRKDLEFIDRDHLLRAIAQLKELGMLKTSKMRY